MVQKHTMTLLFLLSFFFVSSLIHYIEKHISILSGKKRLHFIITKVNWKFKLILNTRVATELNFIQISLLTQKKNITQFLKF